MPIITLFRIIIKILRHLINMRGNWSDPKKNWPPSVPESQHVQILLFWWWWLLLWWFILSVWHSVRFPETGASKGSFLDLIGLWSFLGVILLIEFIDVGRCTLNTGSTLPRQGILDCIKNGEIKVGMHLFIVLHSWLWARHCCTLPPSWLWARHCCKLQPSWISTTTWNCELSKPFLR